MLLHINFHNGRIARFPTATKEEEEEEEEEDDDGGDDDDDGDNDDDDDLELCRHFGLQLYICR